MAQSDHEAEHDLHAAVERYRQVMRSAEAELLQAVNKARTAGVSWTSVGAAFGISRQAAWERFSGKLSGFTGGPGVAAEGS